MDTTITTASKLRGGQQVSHIKLLDTNFYMVAEI